MMEGSCGLDKQDVLEIGNHSLLVVGLRVWYIDQLNENDSNSLEGRNRAYNSSA